MIKNFIYPFFCAAAFCPLVVAADDEFYLGLSLGQGVSDISARDEAPEIYELGNQGGIPVTGPIDNKDNAINLFVGYHLGNRLAVEGGYVNFGSVVNGHASVFDMQSSIGDVRSATQFRRDVEGPHISILAKHQVSDSGTFFGKLGVFLWDAEALHDRALYVNGDDSGSGRVTVTDSGTGVVAGIGLNLWFFRVGYEVYNVDDFKVDFLNIGVKVELD